MNDVMEPLIKQNGAVNATVEYLGKIDGKWLGVPATVGSQIKGPCSRIDLHEAARRHRRAGDVSRRARRPRPTPGRFDTFLKAAEACHKGGHPFGIGARHDGRQCRHRGRDLPRLRRHAGRRQGQHHGQERCGAPGARLLQAADGVPAVRCAVVGRRLEQQVPGLGPGRADHEPAVSAWAVAKRDAPKVAEQLLDARLRRPDRRAAMRRSCRTSGASGTSARTRRRPRA